MWFADAPTSWGYDVSSHSLCSCPRPHHEWGVSEQEGKTESLLYSYTTTICAAIWHSAINWQKWNREPHVVYLYIPHSVGLIEGTQWKYLLDKCWNKQRRNIPYTFDDDCFLPLGLCTRHSPCWTALPNLTPPPQHTYTHPVNSISLEDFPDHSILGCI